MVWSICLSISVLIFVFSVGYSVVLPRIKRRNGTGAASPNFMFIGVVLSAAVMFYPIYAGLYSTAGLKTFLLSFHHAMRLFVMDGEFSFIADHLKTAPAHLAPLYFFYAAILYITAPALTLSAVLSFFKSFKAYHKLIFSANSPVYVFSEWNERACALGKSIKAEEPKAQLVFMNVTDEGNTEDRRLPGAVYFSKNILAVDFEKYHRESRLSFFVMGKDEDENTDLALKLIAKYQNCSRAKLYVFSTKAASEVLFAAADPCSMKIRRINETQSFVFNELYVNGFSEIFQPAKRENAGGKISAIIVGFDSLGFELTRTLPWFCQMDGYRAEIHTFAAEDASEKLEYFCPELMDSNHNGQLEDPGEAQYKVTVHDHTNFFSNAFYEAISQIKDATVVYVTLGDDEFNIEVSVELRRRFERMHIHPIIRAVVRSSDKRQTLLDSKNFSGQAYDIKFIGDTDSLYAHHVIISTELEKEALERHLHWGKEEDFWRYEYNYRSSMASALHRKMKQLCKIPGIDVPPEDRKEADLWALRKLEHRRWNAFIRSEGFVYSGSVQKSSRNNLAKVHNCLVPFDMLSLEDQQKDDD